MKFYLLLLLLISTFLIRGQNFNQNEGIDGKYFVWESESELGLYGWSKYSVVYFDSDTVRIIDFPDDPAGMLGYKVGTYFLSDSPEDVMCSINKNYTISLNIGQIVWGTRKCKTEKILTIEKNQKISMEVSRYRNKISKDNTVERVKELETRLYVQINKDELKHKVEWLKVFEQYKRHPKIQKCRKKSKKT